MNMMNKNNKEKIYYIPEYKEKDEDKNIVSKYQDIYISKGFPVISCTTINGGELAVNNEEFIVEKINDKNITLKSERPDGEHLIELSMKDFRKQFLLAFCITIHKSQGSTIDNKLTIWDWGKMNNKLKYTAITRATKYENINMINHNNVSITQPTYNFINVQI